ncbi:histidinol-phosphatase HisJ [Bacillus sp. SM2101]|uniref:histidinol-phosphatase HisJ n=1 Tax=Bacillus sp. SM2101 TaxID=2805366 RepID=UPI001BDEA53A|nr:histidinol-phosphatase HisJ [Bacillus sp. SM2101]
MKSDGHVHTPYCPHGTDHSIEQYINRALSLNLSEISFTEHAPLPVGFEDPTPQQDSAMKPSQLEEYIATISTLKEKYKSEIKINIGLEVDYIQGFESETKEFLNTYGAVLDDSILSVHFLLNNGAYHCIDYSPEMFHTIIQKIGSIEKVYQQYYETVYQSVIADLGEHKPKRIGHITLVKKFQKKFPCKLTFSDEIVELLSMVKKEKMQLDYNGAGVNKPLCKEAYPSDWIILEAIKQGIPLVYGSDAHSVKDLGQGYSHIICKDYLKNPTSI